METPSGTPQRRAWHVSHGFVFANDNRVAYPRLSLARYHSAPALATSQDSPPEPSLGGLPCGTTSESQLCGSAGDGRQVPVADNPKPTEQTAAVVDQLETAAGEDASTGVSKPKGKPPIYKPPFTPLEFKIPDEVFQTAKNAAEGTPESFWSYNLYRGPSSEPEAPGPKVKVHYSRSKHTTERVLQQYFMDEPILGFDLEWAADATKSQGPRRNVSLVQLASPSRIALFHLALYPKDDDMVAPSLKKIIEDPEVTKVGVWIKGDCTRMRKFLDIKARSIFELSHLYRLVKYSTTGQLELVNKKLVNMASQVHDCLQLPLFKGLDVRASDWSRALRMDQIIYSASDAYAALHLYHVLDHERKSLDPTPPLPHHADLNLPIRFADQVVLPAAEDEIETKEELTAESDAPESTAAFTEYLNSVDMKSSVNLEEEDSVEQQPGVAITKETVSASIATTDTTATTTAITSGKQAASPKDARVEEAELWARQRCAGPNAGKAPAYILRAYYLWHKNQDLGPEEIAALLRDPPLATMTVVGYIAEAIRADRLVFDKKRLWDEVLAKLPKSSLETWKFRGLVKACKED